MHERTTQIVLPSRGPSSKGQAQEALERDNKLKENLIPRHGSPQALYIYLKTAAAFSSKTTRYPLLQLPEFLKLPWTFQI